MRTIASLSILSVVHTGCLENGGLPRCPRRPPGVPGGHAIALDLRGATATQCATGGMPTLISCTLTFASRTRHPAAPSLFSPRRAHRATISPGLCATKQRGGSAHVMVPFAKRAEGLLVRGGAQVGQALTRRLGGLCIKRKFIKKGQGKDEDKGVDDGGGHAAGRG
jgi:hypothetical protein